MLYKAFPKIKSQTFTVYCTHLNKQKRFYKHVVKNIQKFRAVKDVPVKIFLSLSTEWNEI